MWPCECMVYHIMPLTIRTYSPITDENTEFEFILKLVFKKYTYQVMVCAFLETRKGLKRLKKLKSANSIAVVS